MMECHSSARKEWELVCLELAEEGAPGLFKVHPDGLHPPRAHCPPSPSDSPRGYLGGQRNVMMHHHLPALACLGQFPPDHHSVEGPLEG